MKTTEPWDPLGDYFVRDIVDDLFTEGQMSTCYKCGDVLIPNRPCSNPNCEVSHKVYAEPGRSEASVGNPGSEGVRQRDEEDRCPHCGRRSGGGEIHIRSKQGSDDTTVAYVPGLGTVSVKGRMSIRGQGVEVTPSQHVNVVSHRSG